jgi:hypothetical protein
MAGVGTMKAGAGQRAWVGAGLMAWAGAGPGVADIADSELAARSMGWVGCTLACHLYHLYWVCKFGLFAEEQNIHP